MHTFEWVETTTLADALGALHPRAQVKAGGVDLMDLMKEGIIRPERLVNIKRVKGLDGIAQGEAGLKVGPLVTLARIASEPLVIGGYKALADAAGLAATPQIRNMASAGGNLLQRPRCWYFRQEAFPCKKKGGQLCFAQMGENQYHAIFDNHTCAIVHPSALATALVAFGAKIELASAEGKREVLLESFFILPEESPRRENLLAPGEVLTEIRVPSAAGLVSAYTKQGELESHDWPLAEVAVVLEKKGDTVSRASVVLGAAAPVPHRAKGAEAALTGKPLTEAVAREAARAAVEGATPLANNKYKVPMFEALVRRTILKAGGVA
jgi:xanthine dehydrogenase YagS FAD-binding subunit